MHGDPVVAGSLFKDAVRGYVKLLGASSRQSMDLRHNHVVPRSDNNLRG